jgi:serine/threonine protein phosphatase PrpC
MRAECFGQSRPQEGRQQTLNQDAFLIGRQPVPWMALCDGGGNAQSVAKRALGLLETRMGEATLGQLLRDETWVRWAKGLDSALLGGSEATLVAVAAVGEQVIGVCAGDSRAYLVPLEGPVRLLTGSASRARLGSGETLPTPFRDSLAPRDVLLLASDGAWSPLGTAGIEAAVRSKVMKAFADMPSAVLEGGGGGFRDGPVVPLDAAEGDRPDEDVR